MPKYVELDTERFQQFLRACGFARSVQGKEIIYKRANHHLDAVVVKVYTTIPLNRASKARERGQDAIRVTCAYESEVPFRGKTSFGIHKCTKTLRSGSEEAIFDRVYHRMREAFAEGNAWLRKNWPELQAAHKKAEQMVRNHRP